jgi:hypothetical protein
MTPVKGRLANLYNQEITIEFGTEAAFNGNGSIVRIRRYRMPDGHYATQITFPSGQYERAVLQSSQFPRAGAFGDS